MQGGNSIRKIKFKDQSKPT